MSNYNSLKATINANIKTNGNQEITGSVLNSVLNAMVTTIGAGYQYAGIATPSANPGSPDNKVFYLAAAAGTYTNFGGLEVADGEVAILKWDTTWHKDVTGVATNESLALIKSVIDGFNHVDFYVSSTGYWKRSSVATYDAVVVPVSANDVINITWRVVVGSIRGLYSTYPELSGQANNLLTGFDATAISEELTMPSSGYFVFWVTNNNLDKTPVSLTLNGEDIYSYMYSIRGLFDKQKQEIENLNTRVSSAEDNINLLSGNLSAQGARIDDVEDKIGDVHIDEQTLPVSLIINGIRGDINSSIDIRTTTGYAYVVYSVVEGETYSVKTRTGTSNNYPYYVYLTDNNNVIKDRKIAKQSSVTIQTETIVIPSGVTKMWVMQYEATPIYVDVKKSIIVDLQSQIDNNKSEMDKVLQSAKMITDHGMFDLESDWWIGDRFLDEQYKTQEDVAVLPFLEVINGRVGSGVLQVAVISDTHGSGAYSWQNILRSITQVCHRSIAVFNRIAAECDIAFHGGDLSSDYGTSRIRDLQYMHEIVRKFCFNKPFFITKGNHDENNNAYVEADMLNLDWQNNTYYVRNFSSFTAVTEDTWDGSPLYVTKTELVSDREFRSFAQHWLCPSGAVWGNGAYYYYDIDSVKIRVIVGNSFPVNDNHEVSETEEYLWMGQVALNLSDKDDPSEWSVIMLRHTQSTSITNLADCINAFRNGGTWTYGGETIDFGSLNGGGMTFIAHIHGHEHTKCFSNGAGFLDLGETSSFVQVSSLGDASKYGICVLSIDTINKKIYDDTLSGVSYCYNYATNKVELRVGDIIRMAASGLPSPTLSSSDTGIATCNDLLVTAVSVGDCTITITGSNGNSFNYPISVVE